MESGNNNNQKKENFLEKYPYLKPLLQNYDPTKDRTCITMNDYIVFLNRIVIKHSKTSDSETVDSIKNLFFILIKNSIRMNMDSILFKALSYFIKEGFIFFISSLKSDKDVNRKQFIAKLFSKLDHEKISKSFNLDKTEVENELKLISLIKAIKEKKFIFKQIIGTYIFLFFRNFIEKNDKEIKDELFKYMKEKDWKEFYKVYEEFKICDDFERKLNTIFAKESLDKNEIIEEFLGNKQYSQNLEKDVTNLKANILPDKEERDNPEDSQNNEQKSNEMNNGNSEQKSTEINDGNDGNSEQKSIEINNGNSEQKSIEMNNGSIEQKINEMNDAYSEQKSTNINDGNSEQKIIEINNRNSEQKDAKINDGNSEQKSTEMNNGNIEQKNTKINDGNIEQKSTGMNNANENKTDKKKIIVLNNEQLSEKYSQLSEKFSHFLESFEKQNNEIKSMKKTINVLSDKLDLSILINNLSTQRDCYKKALEILIKYLNKELKLNLVLTGDDIWKQTKTVIKKISESKLNEKYRQKIIGSLKGLLFCKDYANCLTYRKSTFSEELDNYYKNKNETQIIATASYENMKKATKMFFKEKINTGEIQIINNLLFQKMEKWKNDNEIDYTQYFSRNKIDCEILLKHFSFAENIIESFGLNEEIDNELLNN